MTGALDGDGQLTLMLGAGTGHTAGQDLAALGNVTAKLGDVLVVDVLDLLGAEGADLAALAGTGSGGGTLGALGTGLTVGVIHDVFLLFRIKGRFRESETDYRASGETPGRHVYK